MMWTHKGGDLHLGMNRFPVGAPLPVRQRSNAPAGGHVAHLRVHWVNPAGVSSVYRHPIIIPVGKMSPDPRYAGMNPRERVFTTWLHAIDALRRHQPTEAWLNHVDVNDIKLETPSGDIINGSVNPLYRDLHERQMVNWYDDAPHGLPSEEARDGFETRDVRIVLSVHD